MLHDLLRDQAALRPLQPAVRDRSATLSYAALEALAEKFRGGLSASGIRPGDRVGLLLEKSTTAIAAIFGILTAGAACVPLDPRAPAQRTASTVHDAALHGLITTSARLAALRSHLPALPPCLLLTDAALGDGAPAAPLRRDRRQPAEALAYILYTSGSTGTPKGVMLSHAAVLSFVRWATSYFALQPADIVASHAPLHFDLSTFDIFATLAAGGTVALVPSEVAMFPRDLAAWIAEANITVWYSVPSALVQLLQRAGLAERAFPALRLVLFAGEVFPTRPLGELMRLLPAARHFNLYGPTETNVCSVHEVTAPPSPDAPPIPIGTACAHCTIRVRRDDGLPAAAGEIGELVVSGASLMQGYWGKPGLTEASLVPDPIDPAGECRFYRTGDYGWLGSDGELRYVGRRDSQVKLRGHRVELGDVEAALQQHPAVLETAVVPVPCEPHGLALTAFVVLGSRRSLDRRELATFCGELLPAYMLPREYVVTAALPRTATGKIDRAALAASDQIRRKHLASRG